MNNGHILLDIGQDGWLKPVSFFKFGSLRNFSAISKCCSFLNTHSTNSCICFSSALFTFGPISEVISKWISYFDLFHFSHEFFHEFIINIFMDIHAFIACTHLPAVIKPGVQCSGNCVIDVGILKCNERCLSSKLQLHMSQVFRSSFKNGLTCRSATSHGHHFGNWMLHKGSTHSSPCTGDDIQHTIGNSGFFSQISQASMLTGVFPWWV